MTDESEYQAKKEQILISYWRDMVALNREMYASLNIYIKQGFLAVFFRLSFLLTISSIAKWLLDRNFSNNGLTVFALICVPLLPFLAHQFYYRSAELKLRKSFANEIFKDIPDDVLSGELKFIDRLLKKLKIPNQAVVFRQYPANKTDVIFVSHHLGIYYVILGNRFFSLLQERPCAAEVMICHELAHIRHGDLDSFHAVKIFLRGFLGYYIPPLVLLLCYYWFADGVKIMTNVVFFFWMLMMQGIAIIQLTSRIIDFRAIAERSEMNADLLCAMCCGTEHVLSALKEVQAKSNFFSLVLTFSPSIRHRIRNIELLVKEYGDISVPIELDKEFENLNIDQLPVELHEQSGWPTLFVRNDIHLFNGPRKILLILLMCLASLLAAAFLIALHDNLPSVIEGDRIIISVFNLIELLGFLFGLSIFLNRKVKILITILVTSFIAVVFHTTLILEIVREPNYEQNNLALNAAIGSALVMLTMALLNSIAKSVSKGTTEKKIFGYSTMLFTLLCISLFLFAFKIADKRSPNLINVIRLGGTSYVTEIQTADCKSISVNMKKTYRVEKIILVENGPSLLFHPRILDTYPNNDKRVPAKQNECYFGSNGLLSFDSLDWEERRFFENEKYSILFPNENVYIRTQKDKTYWVLLAYGTTIAKLVSSDGFGLSEIKEIVAPSYLVDERKFLISADKKYLLIDGFEGELRIYRLMLD